MVFRSVRNPIFLGLGTAAITALSAAVPIAVASSSPAPPSPAPPSSPPASPDPTGPPQGPAAVPKLIVLVNAPGTVHGGDSVSIGVEVFALEANAGSTTLTATAPGAGGVPKTFKFDVNMVSTAEDVQARSVTLTIPKNKTSGSVTLTAKADATDPAATDGEAVRKISVTKRPASGSTGGSGGSGGTSGSGSPTGTSGIGGIGGTGTTPSLADPGFVPASPSGSLQNPQVALPQIAPQGPATAPAAAAAAPNTLRSGGVPGTQELTFERLASTQAAWLAALIVAFSLLMTQLRMARPYNTRWTGDHRRPRRGLFQR